MQMSSITSLVFLVLLLVVAVSAAAIAYQGNRRRARVLTRTGLTGGGVSNVPLIAVAGKKDGVSTRLGEIAERFLPEGALVSGDSERMLIQAGFESEQAASIYGLIRLGSALGLPAALFAWGLNSGTLMMLMSVVVGIGLGLIGPPAILARLQRLRGERIRKAIPDTLDLLLVCVEAGVSLDAAILRVGREMMLLHPDFSYELMMMNRRMNAGMRREDALHALYERTGVAELRSLGANMIQSERWGTSIAQVLRVYSESLRRKRRQVAEKKAAVAATKMIFPLGLFILPALVAIIGGPAVLAMGAVFDSISR
jgi:tight adherence protein C